MDAGSFAAPDPGEVARLAAARHDVLTLPTVILFCDGAPVERRTGAVKPKRLDAAVAAHVTEPRP